MDKPLIPKKESAMRMTETTSQIGPEKTAPVIQVLSRKTKMMYRRSGFFNLLKMGHCAPAVMKTLQDLGNTEEEWHGRNDYRTARRNW